MGLQIYGIAASRALRPLWVAHEMGLVYEHMAVHYVGGATRTPEILAINPNGHIPIVKDGDVVVWESMAQCLWLAQVHGAGKPDSIAPQSANEWAAAYKWSFWTVTECEKDALTVLMHRLAMPEPERKPELATQAESRLRVPMRVLDGAVASMPYLAGDRFTVADVCAASVLFWARSGKFDFTDFPNAKRWLDACLSRPAFLEVRALSKQGR
jgi:glutathione S-transferase